MSARDTERTDRPESESPLLADIEAAEAALAGQTDLEAARDLVVAPPLTKNLTPCSRCLRPHTDVEFREFSRILEINGIRITHWATCPVTDEPILLQTTDALGAVLPGDDALSAYLPPEQLEEAQMTSQDYLRAHGWRGPRTVEESDDL